MICFLLRALTAAAMSLSLFMDFRLLSANNYENWSAMTTGHTFAIFVLSATFFALLSISGKRYPRRGKGLTCLAVFLGAWWLLAQVHADKYNVPDVFATGGQLLKLLVSFAGMGCIFDLLLRMLDHVLMIGADLPPLFRKDGFPLRLYRAHPMALCAAVVFVCWLPHLIISYPAAMNWDTAMQIEQAIGTMPYDGNHPPVSTVIVGAAVHLGVMIGSLNLGLFSYVLVQSLMGAAIVGYAQSVLFMLRAPRWLRLLTLLTCAVSPCYADNVTVILKDIPYSFGAMLLACELVRLCVLRQDGYVRSRGFALRFMLACLLMTLFRNNGFGIIIPIVLLLVAGLLRKKTASLRVFAALLAPIVLALLIGAFVRTAFDVQSGSIREGLSLPFQQTARFVKLHKDEIPPEEAAVINEVLDYENLPALYDQYISDQVKATIREDVTRGELLAYFGVWGKQFVRDPLCYFKATLIQNALLFDPQTRNVAFFDEIGMRGKTEVALGAYKPDITRRLMDREVNLRKFLFAVPGYEQLTSVGFFGILMLFACVLSRRERLRGIGPLLVIPVATAVMIVLGPCLWWQDRYGFPIIYTMPLIFGCLHFLIHRTHGSADHIHD